MKDKLYAFLGVVVNDGDDFLDFGVGVFIENVIVGGVGES